MRFRLWMRLILMGRSRSMSNSNKIARYLELKQRRDGMWWLQGKLTAITGAQLNAILDPLSGLRSSSIVEADDTTTVIPDQRPYGQRLHDAFDEVCGLVLKSGDQPVSGGTRPPSS